MYITQTKRKETNTLPGAVSPTNQVSSTSQNEEPVHSSQTSLKMNENFFQTTVNFNSETQKSDKSIKSSMGKKLNEIMYFTSLITNKPQ